MRDRLNAVLVVVVAGLITALSLRPVAAGAGPASSTFQLGHFVLYFLLAGALLLYFHDTACGHMEAVAAAGLFGLGIELVQLHLSFRVFSAADVVVNVLGASLLMFDHRLDVVTRVIENEDELLERYLL